MPLKCSDESLGSPIAKFFSLQNAIRISAWIAFWVDFYLAMDSVINAVTLYNFKPTNVTMTKFKNWPPDRILTVGHISTISGIIFIVAAFFSGVVIEYNQRVGFQSINRKFVTMCKASLLAWGLLEVIVIVVTVFYLKSIYDFQPSSLLALARILFIAFIALRLRQLFLVERRLKARSKRILSSIQI